MRLNHSQPSQALGVVDRAALLLPIEMLLNNTNVPQRAARACTGLGSIGLVAIIAIIYGTAHWLTRSRYLFDLDSILYARALDTFDLRLTQPPLPGYVLYIQIGRLVRIFVSDTNTSLIILSIVFGALLAGAIYLLGRELYDERTGRIAGLLALSGPIYWYQSSFASPRIAEGFFAATIVWVGARLRKTGSTRYFWMLPPILAMAGGVRQQTLLYMLPFCIWATLKVPWRRRVIGAGLLAVGCLAWGIPTLVAAGGLAEYRALSNAQWQEFVVGETGVIYGQTALEAVHRLATNLGLIGLYALYACLPAPLILLLSLKSAPRGSRLVRMVQSFPGQALLFATTPALGFLALIHIQQIGHFLAVAPFVTLVLARILAVRQSRQWPRWGVGLVVLANLAFLLLAPARLVGGHLGTPTITTIRERDHFVESGIALIRSSPPDQTLVITSALSYGFIEEYAPAYEYYLLPGLFEPDPGAGPSRNHQALTNGLRDLPGSLRRGAGIVAAPASARHFVFFGYEVDLTRMVDPAERLERPDPELRSLATIDKASPVDIVIRPQHLDVEEASDGAGR